MYADGQGMGRSMSESVSLWAFVSAENLAAGWISAGRNLCARVGGWISAGEIYADELVGSAYPEQHLHLFIVG